MAGGFSAPGPLVLALQGFDCVSQGLVHLAVGEPLSALVLERTHRLTSLPSPVSYTGEILFAIQGFVLSPPDIAIVAYTYTYNKRHFAQMCTYIFVQNICVRIPFAML